MGCLLLGLFSHFSYKCDNVKKKNLNSSALSDLIYNAKFKLFVLS